MKLHHQKVFRKTLVLLMFVFSISLSSVSFAQEERGIFDILSSFLQTSMTKDSASSRWNILFSSPRKNAKREVTLPRETEAVQKSTGRTSLSDLLKKRQGKSSRTSKSSPSREINFEDYKKADKKARKTLMTTKTQRKKSSVGRVKISCTDTDGGDNEFLRGTATLTMGRQIERFTDESVESGVLEYSCLSRGIEGEFIACDNGSKNGACLDVEEEEPCPMPSCAVPRDGCSYEPGYFANGCPNPCAKLVCDEAGEEDNSALRVADLTWGASSVQFTLFDANLTGGDRYFMECIEEGNEQFTKNPHKYREQIANNGSPYMTLMVFVKADTNYKCYAAVRKLGGQVHRHTGQKKLRTKRDVEDGVGSFDDTPRISFWPGKVNQHNEDGVWKTDPGGDSGAIPVSNKTEVVKYCQKFYPQTNAFREYGTEKIMDWKERGNRNSHISTKPVYECYEEEGDNDGDVTGSIELITNGEDGFFTVNRPLDAKLLSAYIDVEGAMFLNGFELRKKGVGMINRFEFDRETVTNYQVYIAGEKVSTMQVAKEDEILFTFPRQEIKGRVLLEIKALVTPTEHIKEDIKFWLDDSSLNVFYGNGEHVPANNISGEAKGHTFIVEHHVASSLVVETGPAVYSDILVSEQKAEVMKLRFSADEGDVEIKDLHFSNLVPGEFGRVAEFGLYTSSGKLIQMKQIQPDGSLHFDLANQQRIKVEENQSEFVTIKVDMREINDERSTGKKLKLHLASVEAVDGETGWDLPTENYFFSGVESEHFVAYASQVELRHSANQPQMFAKGPHQEIYRFTLQADQAGNVEVARVGLDIVGVGVDLSSVEFILEGARDAGREVATVYKHRLGRSASYYTVDFGRELLSAGEKKEYVLYAKEIPATSSLEDAAISVSFVSKATEAVHTSDSSSVENSYTVWTDESGIWHNEYLLQMDTHAQVLAN